MGSSFGDVLTVCRDSVKGVGRLMDSSAMAAVLGSIVTAFGLYMIAKLNTRGGTVQSALDLQKRYEEINKENAKEMKEMRMELNELKEKINDMQKQFDEKESFYKYELEKKDDRIDELEDIIVDKDTIIKELKGGF
jgi:TolA-binding protein